LSLAGRGPATDRNAHPKGGTDEAMAAKQLQQEAANSLFRAIIETLDKNRTDGTLTAAVLEELGRAYASVSTNVPDPGRLG
jgi:hypothetical protein